MLILDELIFRKDPEWRKSRILKAMDAYAKAFPKGKKVKRPDLEASKTGFDKIFLRNSTGLLVAIWGETSGKFHQVTPVKILKHSIKIYKPNPQIKKQKNDGHKN